MATPGKLWAFVLAAALIGGRGFGPAGLAGTGLVMVALVPVTLLVLVTLWVSR